VFDAQIEWIEPGGGRAPVGTFTGPQSVADKVFALVPQNFDEFQAEPQQFIDSGEHVVVIGHFRGRSKGASTLDAPFVHVWRMRNGKAIRFQHYVGWSGTSDHDGVERVITMAWRAQSR
jgi:uncharacterized protein